MTRAWSQSRRFVFIAFLVPSLLAAQEKTKWDQDFQDGVKAFAAGHYAEAVESLTAALQDAQAFPPLDLRRADTAHLLGVSYQFQGRFDRAEPLYMEAGSILEANGETGRKLLGITLDSLSQLRFEQERWKDAEELAHQAIELCSQTRGERDACTLPANRHLGEIYSTQGRIPEAETIFQQVIDAARKIPTFGPQLLPNALRDQAFIVVAKGQYRLAEPLLKEALDLSNKLGEERSEVADSLLALARLYRAENDTARAEPLLTRAAAIYEKNNGPCLAHALQEQGLIAITEGKYAVARQNLLRSVSIYQAFLGADHLNVAFAQVGLAEAALGERNYAEAAAHYRQALDIYRRTTTRNNPARVMAERQYEWFSKSFRK